MRWRTIIELSSMSNNDEFVVHTDHEITVQDLDQFRDLSWGGTLPKLVTSRRVLPLEIEAGLNTTFRGRIESAADRNLDENAPRVTRTLDELHKLLRQLHFWIVEMEIHPHQAIADIISRGFYDCMSAGLSFTALSALRAIIERHHLPSDLELDVNGATVADFLRQIEDVPRFENLLPPDATTYLLEIPRERH